MSSKLVLVVALLAVTAACVESESTAADPAVGGAVASLAPSSGKADSSDQADHACQIVLRDVGRMPGGNDYEMDCSSGSCLYVWRGRLEVAETTAADATVHVLYHLTSDSTWWEVEAALEPDGAPGYRRYSFALSEHLFGPQTAEADELVIELVAFVRLAGGERVFDHNRYQADFDNHLMTAELGFTSNDGGACQPVVGNIHFSHDYSEHAHGIRRQGGYLRVDYDIDRLSQCRGTHNGYPAWDVVAHAKFFPGGQLLSGSVRELIVDQGTPTNEAVDQPLVVKIPADATAVELWFRNFGGAGSSCEAWDSNLSANYRYDIWPAADDPRCLDVEKENGSVTEDHRMVHNSPHCVDYELSSQFDASFCELYLQGFGLGHMGHYGIPHDWLVAYLKVGPQDGELLGVGMFTRYHDVQSGQPGERFSFGVEVASEVWKTGFNHHVTGMYNVQGRNYAVDELAFFIDVRRPSGHVERLWQSHHGDNYSWDDAFSLPSTKQYIPYGNIQWANEASTIFESRHACL